MASYQMPPTPSLTPAPTRPQHAKSNEGGNQHNDAALEKAVQDIENATRQIVASLASSSVLSQNDHKTRLSTLLERVSDNIKGTYESHIPKHPFSFTNPSKGQRSLSSDTRSIAGLALPSILDSDALRSVPRAAEHTSARRMRLSISSGPSGPPSIISDLSDSEPDIHKVFDDDRSSKADDDEQPSAAHHSRQPKAQAMSQKRRDARSKDRVQQLAVEDAFARRKRLSISSSPSGPPSAIGDSESESNVIYDDDQSSNADDDEQPSAAHHSRQPKAQAMSQKGQDTRRKSNRVHESPMVLDDNDSDGTESTVRDGSDKQSDVEDEDRLSGGQQTVGEQSANVEGSKPGNEDDKQNDDDEQVHEKEEGWDDDRRNKVDVQAEEDVGDHDEAANLQLDEYQLPIGGLPPMNILEMDIPALTHKELIFLAIYEDCDVDCDGPAELITKFEGKTEDLRRQMLEHQKEERKKRAAEGLEIVVEHSITKVTSNEEEESVDVQERVTSWKPVNASSLPNVHQPAKKRARSPGEAGSQEPSPKRLAQSVGFNGTSSDTPCPEPRTRHPLPNQPIPIQMRKPSIVSYVIPEWAPGLLPVWTQLLRVELHSANNSQTTQEFAELFYEVSKGDWWTSYLDYAQLRKSIKDGEKSAKQRLWEKFIAPYAEILFARVEASGPALTYELLSSKDLQELDQAIAAKSNDPQIVGMLRRSLRMLVWPSDRKDWKHKTGMVQWPEPWHATDDQKRQYKALQTLTQNGRLRSSDAINLPFDTRTTRLFTQIERDPPLTKKRHPGTTLIVNYNSPEGVVTISAEAIDKLISGIETTLPKEKFTFTRNNKRGSNPLSDDKQNDLIKWIYRWADELKGHIGRLFDSLLSPTSDSRRYVDMAKVIADEPEDLDGEGRSLLNSLLRKGFKSNARYQLNECDDLGHLGLLLRIHAAAKEVKNAQQTDDATLGITDEERRAILDQAFLVGAFDRQWGRGLLATLSVKLLKLLLRILPTDSYDDVLAYLAKHLTFITPTLKYVYDNVLVLAALLRNELTTGFPSTSVWLESAAGKSWQQQTSPWTLHQTIGGKEAVMKALAQTCGGDVNADSNTSGGCICDGGQELQVLLPDDKDTWRRMCHDADQLSADGGKAQLLLGGNGGLELSYFDSAFVSPASQGAVLQVDTEL